MDTIKIFYKSIMFRITFVSLIFNVQQSVLIAQAILWSNTFENTEIFSSPRTIDLTQNGVKDIVIGGGVEGAFSPYIIMALNGQTGDTLWSHKGIEHLFSDPVFADVTGDGKPNVFIAGRGASLFCLDGETGEIIWRYSNCYGELTCLDTLPNIYTPKIIPDISGNGYPDLLITKGGYPPASAGDPNRPPGYLMILEGSTGEELKSSVAPDSFEIYSSPMIVQLQEGGQNWIFFGTGGETLPGSAWAITLDDFVNGELNFIEIANGEQKGFMGPVSYADLNHDGVLDIICVNFDGIIHAIDGSNFQELWTKSFPGYESYSNPTIGFFNLDNTPDVAVKIYKGQWPQYQSFEKVLLNGENGSVLNRRATGFFNMNSSLAYRNISNTHDELIYTNNDKSSGEKQLVVYTFDPVTTDSTAIFEVADNYIFTATPLLEDVNQNGFLELIIVHNTEINLFPASEVTVIETDIPVIKKSWGGYMGNLHDGVFRNTLVSSVNSLKLVTDNPYSVQKLTNHSYRFFTNSHEFNHAKINIYDSLGRLVLLESFDNVVDVNLQQSASGIFIYQIVSEKNTVQSGLLYNN